MRAQAIMLAVVFATAATAARAEPARAPLLRCAGLNEVAARISWCSQNKVALQPARDCRDALLRLWKESAAELAATLSDRNHQKYSAQDVEVANTKADLSRAHARLAELIRATDESAALISRYPLAMIEPVGMSRKPRCWTETWDELVQVVRTLDEKLAEGRRTAAEVRQLGARTGLALASLDRDPGLQAPAVKGQAQALAVPAGTSQASASDVTGLDVDQKKRGAYLEPMPWSQKVAAQKLGAPDASPTPAQAPSTITRRSGLGEKLDPLGTFSSRGSLQRESPLAVAAPASGPGASSVGAALFGSTLGLEAEMATSRSLLPSWQQEEEAGPAGASAPVAAAAADSLPASGVRPLGEIAPAFAGNRAPASVALAQAEAPAEGRTLFAQVSARYKRTDLFRRARLQALPLTAELAR